MVRLTTETNHEQVLIHFIHDENLDISVQDLTECKTVSINFNQDLHIFLTPDQAKELLDFLAQSELIRSHKTFFYDDFRKD
tara:strand:- start:382 stop:624 length:243 start_codon:yes stop_codon:yes gene_type:complete